jgi:SAM-dependent methyltransferase
VSSPETTWGIGEYPLMARHLQPAAVAAVDAAAVLASERVVDVATGTGNVALVAAERGGQVIGVDFEPALLRVAEQRARDAERDVRWLSGDMVALPVPDDWADVVLSVFGVMYAADQAAAAGELARVAAPGARVVLASWLPGSVLPAMGQVLSGYLSPPPTGGGPPSRWGDPGALKTLLEDSGLRVTATSVQRLALDFPDAPAAADFLVRTAGHVVSEQQRLTDDGRWDDLRHDLVRFVRHRADPNSKTLRLTLEYLLATASKQPPADTSAVP